MPAAKRTAARVHGAVQPGPESGPEPAPVDDETPVKAKKAKGAKKAKKGKAVPVEPATPREMLEHLTRYLENVHERLIGKHEGAEHDARIRELWDSFHAAARSLYEE